ncbi:MAG: cupin-like domain-containing protein [Gammaproteobacteria bacterium]|nr:cupin-like domain-containing protein [Gammaproteobacteria bacterium]
MTAAAKQIREIVDFDPDNIFSQFASATSPVILRGLAANWPLVQKGRESSAAAMRYLLEFYQDSPVTAFVSESDIGGRMFYTEGLTDTNFRQVKTELSWVLDKLQEYESLSAPPTIYMGSAAIDLFLPGLSTENSLPQGDFKATVRIWVGNRTTVAAHYDVFDNIACVCAGRRRFTVFPPEQLANLYVGPIDFTPAGQSISLVDINNPDFEKFPRFAAALEQSQSAVLEPGDAIFIPSMWWHHVEGLESFNILINHWWREAPAYMAAPGDVLLHAILGIRDLPAAQRKAWKVFFDHYIFESDSDTVRHIPPDRRGFLGELDEDSARRIRASLRTRLNR